MDEPKKSAQRLMDYYGTPQEVCTNRLIWYETEDGWKRSILVNEMIPHNFPSPHHDYLEQSINYQVPVNMISQLASYDGSVIVERTKGEISARCGGTSMNFVAINLAHDIITGKLTVMDARDRYTILYKEFKEGKKSSYTQKFQFELEQKNTPDKDIVTL
ncbi:MAG: hypothetical protein WC489_04995 [Patescibacteria group bacterium]